METVLDAQIMKQIQQAFDGIEQPVQLLLFTSNEMCDYCGETKKLLDEVVALHPKIELSVHDIHQEPETASRYGVTNAPGNWSRTGVTRIKANSTRNGPLLPSLILRLCHALAGS